jgi:hypothetical protein
LPPPLLISLRPGRVVVPGMWDLAVERTFLCNQGIQD